jgi:hypothetical protein
MAANAGVVACTTMRSTRVQATSLPSAQRPATNVRLDARPIDTE